MKKIWICSLLCGMMIVLLAGCIGIPPERNYIGIATGEGGYLEKFIALWLKTQNDKSVDEFIVFCRKNWCGWEEK